MEPEIIEDTPNNQVTRRRVISGIAGVGAAVIAGTTLARAQDSTGTPTTGTGTDSTEDTQDTTTPDDQKAISYQTFITKLAAELSISDPTTLDTDIRDALKAMVDDVLAAGDIAANAATDLKTAIDESTSPIRVGIANGGRGGGFGGPGMNQHRSNRGPGNNKSNDENGSDSENAEATPTT